MPGAPGPAARGRSCPADDTGRHKINFVVKLKSEVAGCPGVRGPGVRRPRQRDNARQGVDQLTDVLNEVPRNSDFVTMTKFSNEPFSYLRLLA